MINKKNDSLKNKLKTLIDVIGEIMECGVEATIRLSGILTGIGIVVIILQLILSIVLKLR